MNFSDALQEAKATKRRIFKLGLLLCVVIPTLISAIYYGLIASPIFTSKATFTISIQQNKLPSAGQGGISSLLMGSGGNQIQEANIIKEYIYSEDMVRLLSKKIDLYSLYNQSNVDFFSLPPKDPTIEEFKQYYDSMIKVIITEPTYMIRLEVDAFSEENAHIIANTIVQATENFVNERSKRSELDALSFAEQRLKESENQVLQVNQDIARFRSENKQFDPTSSVTGVLSIAQNLEAELANTKTEIASLGHILKRNNPKIKALQSKAYSIQQQIKSQNNRIAAKGGAVLSNLSQKFEALKLASEFAIKRYTIALTAYDMAKSSMAKQRKYLVRVVGPTLPEESLKPTFLYNVLTVFLTMITLYILLTLMLSALKDHFLE